MTTTKYGLYFWDTAFPSNLWAALCTAQITFFRTKSAYGHTNGTRGAMWVNKTVKSCMIIFKKRKRSRRVWRIHSDNEGESIMSMITITFPEWTETSLCYLILMETSARSLSILLPVFWTVRRGYWYWLLQRLYNNHSHGQWLPRSNLCIKHIRRWIRKCSSVPATIYLFRCSCKTRADWDLWNYRFPALIYQQSQKKLPILSLRKRTLLLKDHSS